MISIIYRHCRAEPQGIKFGVNDLLFLMKADWIDHDFICHSLFQELFKRVIPHQCLGALWSRRDKSRDRDAATVAATIEQFNAVSYRVISTVLMPTEAKPQHRAKVITKWIDIAQVSISSSTSPLYVITLLYLDHRSNFRFPLTYRNSACSRTFHRSRQSYRVCRAIQFIV